MLKQQSHTARGTDSPWYRGRDLTDSERAVFRATAEASRAAKLRAVDGLCTEPKHPINKPRLDAASLMPQKRRHALRALSMFSGGGGLDIGFDRAGFTHVASYEVLPEAAAVLKDARPQWAIYGGSDGDVRSVSWSKYRGQVDVLHGGPPCQPFSHAGRRNGPDDERNLIPEFVRAVQAIQPQAFIMENVRGLGTEKFKDYIQSAIIRPLSRRYSITSFWLNAADFGVPQKRERIFFVGFRNPEAAQLFRRPEPTHYSLHLGGQSDNKALPRTMGARRALGLSNINFDAAAPTIRSGLTGPRHTTSVLSSVSALRLWNSLNIWPNGVAPTREMASAYVAKNGHFRLSVADCMVLQGFPADWPFGKPVYLALGLIGNSVAPPMAYQLALSVRRALNSASS